MRVCVGASVRHGTLLTFTGNPVDREAFSLSHSFSQWLGGCQWPAMKRNSSVLSAGMMTKLVTYVREGRVRASPFVHKSLQNYNDFQLAVSRLNGDMNHS